MISVLRTRYSDMTAESLSNGIRKCRSGLSRNTFFAELYLNPLSVIMMPLAMPLVSRNSLKTDASFRLPGNTVEHTGSMVSTS